jgi:hypothetical protein
MQSRALRLLAWAALTAFLAAVIRDYYSGAVLMHNPPSLASKRQLIFWIGLALAAIAWLGVLRYAWLGVTPRRLVHPFVRLHRRIPGVARMALAAVLLLFPTYLFLFTPVGNYDLHYWARFGTLLIFAFLAAGVLFPARLGSSGLLVWAGMVLVAGSVFAACFWLNKVTNYPFSLSWSEGNRLWDYSMLFGRGRYQIVGEDPVFSFISAGRQLLWGLPFVFPWLTIFGARLWDALLWIIPAAWIGWAGVVRQPAAPGAWVWKLGLGLWTFLFLAQGPVYAPLLVSALLVVLALRLRSLPLAALLVILAAYYAHISRNTWSYAPGLWAGMLALLEASNPGLQPRRWKTLLRPVTLGIAGYVGAQVVPVLARMLTGTHEPGQSLTLVMDPVAQVTRQPLLWERLLPNPTYAPGILLGTLWAALPLIVLLVVLRVRRVWQPNWLQLGAAALITTVFLVIGIIASTKIGGGSNLHNLDMFWVSLALLATWLLKDLLRRGPGVLRKERLLQLALALAVLGPASYLVQYGAPLGLPSRQIVDSSLQSLRQVVGEAARQGTVLFLDQRQLLTFHTIQNVPLVTDYEKKYLMEQAMSANEAYFEGFQKDLSQHRFRMIVTEPIHLGLVSEDTRNFAQENNAWVTYVSTPLLEYYEPLTTYSEIGIQLLVPKE